jgi:hypothetical protein
LDELEHEAGVREQLCGRSPMQSCGDEHAGRRMRLLARCAVSAAEEVHRRRARAVRRRRQEEPLDAAQDRWRRSGSSVHHQPPDRQQAG